jgi:hypothetical protein
MALVGETVITESCMIEKNKSQISVVLISKLVLNTWYIFVSAHTANNSILSNRQPPQGTVILSAIVLSPNTAIARHRQVPQASGENETGMNSVITFYT